MSDQDIAYLQQQLRKGDMSASDPLIRAMQRAGTLRLSVHATCSEGARPLCGMIRGEARNMRAPLAGTPIGPTCIVARDISLVTCVRCTQMLGAE